MISVDQRRGKNRKQEDPHTVSHTTNHKNELPILLEVDSYHGIRRYKCQAKSHSRQKTVSKRDAQKIRGERREKQSDRRHDTSDDGCGATAQTAADDVRYLAEEAKTKRV